MSARFWLCALVSAGAALTGGLGLGLYTTTSPKAAWRETELPEAPVQQAGVEMASAGMIGPAIVHCKGCGPTLADRQMAADRAGWDGMNDPVVQHYAAQDEVAPADYAEPPAAPSAQKLPAAIARFASGGYEGSRQPVTVAQAPLPSQDSKTPAEETPADVAVHY